MSITRITKSLRKSNKVKRYLSIKRADYQQVLHEAAVEAGCELRLGQKVAGIDEDLPGVEVEGGEIVQGDLVVVGDGKFKLVSR